MFPAQTYPVHQVFECRLAPLHGRGQEEPFSAHFPHLSLPHVTASAWSSASCCIRSFRNRCEAPGEVCTLTADRVAQSSPLASGSAPALRHCPVQRPQTSRGVLKQPGGRNWKWPSQAVQAWGLAWRARRACCFQKGLLVLHDVAGSQCPRLASCAVLPWAAARKLLPGCGCVLTGASQRLLSAYTAWFLGISPSSCDRRHDRPQNNSVAGKHRSWSLCLGSQDSCKELKQLQKAGLLQCGREKA